MDILGDDGVLALEMAAVKADPDSLGTAERMRRCFPPELVAAALTQVALRRRAREKLLMADRTFFTPSGPEQVTRWVVARWRAARFVEAGVSDVWDLGCGIGVDAMTFAEVGLGVHVVESDPATAVPVWVNLALSGDGGATVGRAEDARVPEGRGTFLDPARRTARGRTWDVVDLTPPWSLVEDHLRGQWVVFVKFDPGLLKQLTSKGIGVAWMLVGDDVVELMLSSASDPDPRVVVFPRPKPESHVLTGGAAPLPVVPPGRFTHEPDNVVIRAGLVAEPAPGGWLPVPGVAYASSDSSIGGPFVTSYRVTDVLDHDVTTFRWWVKQHRIGRLEIKRRAIDIDPAVLRKQLKPRGDGSAILLLARVVAGVRALVVERVG